MGLRPTQGHHFNRPIPATMVAGFIAALSKLG
jgi:hypothetical protein